MLVHEWHQACEQVLGQRLDPVFYETAQAVYRAPRLDAICTGPDRHRQLAVWVQAHQALFCRYHRRLQHRRLQRRRALERQLAQIKLELAFL
jgi:hypothetical protein